MKKKTDYIDIFYQYLDTAEIVYKDDVCITNLNTKLSRYDILPTDIDDVIINPNKTFTVYFNNGEINRFELYTMKAHFYKTEDPDFKKIVNTL